MFSPDLAFGAEDRLLPPSVPFRFFGAAVILHVLAWFTLLVAPEPLTGFTGGGGAVLAALHLFTLGVLAMTAMGAGYQLLPMATIRPVRSVGWSRASFALFLPGVVLFTGGLEHRMSDVMLVGGTLASLGLAVFAALTFDNMRRTEQMPLVSRHVWGALAALLLTVLLGLLALFDLEYGFLPDHQAMAGAHLALAVFGFMGLLVAGFSTILIPMLALARAPEIRLGTQSLALALLALLLALGGTLGGHASVLALAALLGLAGAGLHVEMMRRLLKTRMRKVLGFAFLPIRSAWGFLLLSLALAILLPFDLLPGNGPGLVVVAAVLGWLVTFLFGVLQRILPFLASVHAAGPGGRPPLVSALAPEAPLKLHAAAHLLAVLALLLAMALSLEWLARAAAISGLLGALAFAVFAGTVWYRARACRRAATIAVPR